MPNTGGRGLHTEGNGRIARRRNAKWERQITHGTGFADWVCAEPNDWAFKGSGMRKGDRAGEPCWLGISRNLLVKYESLVVLASGPVYSWNGAIGRGMYATTIYTAEKVLGFQCWYMLVEHGTVKVLQDFKVRLADGSK